MRVLLTGIAGFIGFHTAKRLIELGHQVVGVDSINDYYDLNLKYGRLRNLGFDQAAADSGKLIASSNLPNLQFQKMQLENQTGLVGLAKNFAIDAICHLAAQAGVRYSLENPHAYLHSNLEGFLNILETSRQLGVKHLVYASSSSVYGLNSKQPFSVADPVDQPVSLYAATKKSNELMAHTYAHLYRIPATGLRFFTVYGPWGRPDMALFLFTKAILSGQAIDVYNNGQMQRDFTYIDDIVEALGRVMERPAPEDQQTKVPHSVYNIGYGSPIKLMDFIKAVEKATGCPAVQNFKPLQAGDVLSTWADTSDLLRDFGYKPKVDLEVGVARFVEWYREFYKI